MHSSCNLNTREGETSSSMSTQDSLTDTFRQMSKTLIHNTEMLKSSIETIRNLTGDPTKTVSQEISRPDVVTVEVKCTFLKIVDIDTVSQEYQADIFLQAKWEEPAFAGVKKLPKFNLREHWDPKLIILNSETMSVDRKSYMIRHDKNCTYPVVLLLWRFKGTFRENMELEYFPFDVQDLTVQVASERPYGTVDLIEDQHVLSTVNTQTFLDAQEWNIFRHVETFRNKTTMEFASVSTHPILFVVCRVKRRVGYFMWNIVFIMLLITLLTFVVMAMEPGDGERINVSITLFLTAVAFKLVVKQSLPTISYLTYLDLYILSLLIFLSLQSAEDAFMCALGRRMEGEQLARLDELAQGGLALLLIFFHLFFWLHIEFTALKKRRIMQDKDILYEKQKFHLEKFGKMLYNPGYRRSSLCLDE